MSILKTYIESGLSLLPIRPDNPTGNPNTGKEPKGLSEGTWKKFAVNPMTIDDAAKEFAQGDNLGIIGGTVSGGLVIIDVDCKYDIKGNLWEAFSEGLKHYDKELYDKLVIQSTPSGGYHVFYRCPEVVIPSGKLAMRPSTAEELEAHNATAPKKAEKPEDKPWVLIETKAEGGYVLAAPSVFNGKPYQFIQGELTNIPVLTIEQNEAILHIARSFNEVQVKEWVMKERAQPLVEGEKRPGDDFNDQVGIMDFLERYGWKRGRTMNSNAFEITRPGKKHMEKSGIVAIQQNICYLHTTGDLLPDGRTLNPFAVYAYYEHGGDFSAAGKQLYRDGFGTRRERENRGTTDAQVNPTPPPVETQPEPITDKPNNSEPFALLGYRKSDGTQYFAFFVRSSKIVVELTAPQMSKSNLMTLAPLQWWEMKFPASRGGMDTYAAQNWLIQASNELGFFDAARVRGRGAWRDGKDTIIHVGNELIKNGKPYRLGELSTAHIYEAAASLGLRTENPLNTPSANRLMEMLNLLSWERDVNALLLAGWCVVAPVCGVLEWRPHLWLTGGKGTGKSWIFLKIIRRLLGEASLAVQGKSSEAGIRQMLKYDAVPVVFDEIEATDQDTNSRIQNVLGLMRAASADDGGIHALGTSGGTAQTYRIRSCFAFASISVALDKQSDRSRVTVLGLTKKGTQEQRKKNFDNIQRLYAEIITDDFVHRLQARTISLIPTIIANARTFAAAAAVVIGEQRLGDQIGALLAGAYTLSSDKVITYEKALEWVQAKDWSDEKGLTGTEDETALLGYLMEHITEVEAERRTVKRNVGELVSILRGGVADEVNEEAARQRLYRMGVKVDLEGGFLVVSNSATYIKNLLAKTQWANNHNKILLRLDGAVEVRVARFGSTMSTRAVKIPLEELDKE